MYEVLTFIFEVLVFILGTEGSSSRCFHSSSRWAFIFQVLTSIFQVLVFISQVYTTGPGGAGIDVPSVIFIFQVVVFIFQVLEFKFQVLVFIFQVVAFIFQILEFIFQCMNSSSRC